MINFNFSKIHQLSRSKKIILWFFIVIILIISGYFVGLHELVISEWKINMLNQDLRYSLQVEKNKWDQFRIKHKSEVNNTMALMPNSTEELLDLLNGISQQYSLILTSIEPVSQNTYRLVLVGKYAQLLLFLTKLITFPNLAISDLLLKRATATLPTPNLSSIITLKIESVL